MEEIEKNNKPTPKPSQFFQDPHDVQPEEWLDWGPEQWLDWADSDEYKEQYLNPLNPYKPKNASAVRKIPKLPAVDYRKQQPVLFSRWSTPKPRISSKILKSHQPIRVNLPPTETEGITMMTKGPNTERSLSLSRQSFVL